MSEPIKVFISYSHKDETLRAEFLSHLSGLRDSGLIAPWNDRDIEAGTAWAEDIDQNLEQAHIILFLVSSDFMASRYCTCVELERALERHRNKEAIVIPVIIRDCNWTVTRLKVLQGIPRDNIPVATSDRATKLSRDGLWVQVVKEIGQVAERLRLRLQSEEAAKRLKTGLAEFRQKAEEYYQDGVISRGEQANLDFIAQKYELPLVCINQIMAEVQSRYEQMLRNIADYRQIARDEVIDHGGLTESVQKTLEDSRKLREIPTPQANKINQEILEEWQRQQSDVQKQRRRLEEVRLQQERHEAERLKKLNRYRLELQQALSVGYPLDESVEKGLRDFQLSLELTDGDVASVREDLLTHAEAVYQDKLKHERNDIELKSFSFPVVFLEDNGTEKSRTTETAEYFTDVLPGGVELEMVSIPGGSFQMGSPEGVGSNDERPLHWVTVPPFFLGKFQVTQEQWRAVAGLPKVKQDLDANPSRFKDGKLPVERVSWHDVVEFCDRLSAKIGKQYRLPSEAEWEYSCRAGARTSYSFGNSMTGDHVNCDTQKTVVVSEGLLGIGRKTEKRGIYRQKTTEVGFFFANPWGLYDMHGNVWEWCLDCWHGGYKGAPDNGSAWVTKGNDERRLVRGGSWFINPGYCRSAYRYGLSPGDRYSTLGFRVVCVLS